MGILEGASSFGMMVSPIVGSSLYYLGGYNLPFMVFSSLFFVATLFVNTILSPTVDGSEVEGETLVGRPEKSNDVTMRIFLCAPVTFALLSGGLGYMAWSEFEPLLAIRL